MQVMQFLIDFCTVFNGMVCNEVQSRRFPQLEAMKQFSPQESGRTDQTDAGGFRRFDAR